MLIAGFSLDCERLPGELPALARDGALGDLGSGRARSGDQGWSPGCAVGLRSDARCRGRSSSFRPRMQCAKAFCGSTCRSPSGVPGYPDLAPLFPCAGRMQRAAADLVGIAADGAADRRPWLAHGTWPAASLPLRRDASAGRGWCGAEKSPTTPSCASKAMACMRFRSDRCMLESSSRGTSAFRSSARKCCVSNSVWATSTRGSSSASPSCRHSMAIAWPGRVSGDSTVAYAWAYCMALESIAGCAVPARAVWLRALFLERERIANHLGDLGALGNDAAFAFGLAQFSRLREDWLRLSKEAFGHRLMMDCVVPGGVAGRRRARARRPPGASVRHHRARSSGSAPGVR
jgi:hypothetical protein